MTNTRPTTHYSITAAHRITGKSRTTIQRHLKKGKLSFVEDDDGIKRIDASELIRVYGDDCDFSREETAPAQTKQQHQSGSATISTEVDSLRQRLDLVEEERRRERARLESEVEHLRDALQRAQESGSRALLLLEDRSGREDLHQAIDRLEKRFNGQDADQSTTARRRAQAAWLDRPWWSVLIGSRSGQLS